MSRSILVTGSTGKQGGAVIAALLAAKADFRILALTRNISSPSATKLAAKSSNITLVQGDLDDADTVFKNARKAASSPIWGVFSVQGPPMGKDIAVIEEQQGKDLVSAALRNEVKHFVYTSVDRHGARSIENPTTVPHFISKHRIEQHLLQQAKGTGMGWTVLRPVAFMENFDGGMLGKVFASCWKSVVTSRPLQLVATSDIGVFAAKAFMDADAYRGKAISLAGDDLTFEQMSAVFKAKTGSDVPLSWSVFARIALLMSKELSTMFDFFEKEGYGADVEELRKVHPGLKSLGDWLETSVYAKQ